MTQTLLHTFDNGQMLYLVDPVSAPLPAGTINLDLGPHLFLDPYLLENPGFNRVIHSPQRTRPAPLLTGKLNSASYKVANFSSDVLYSNGKFTMYYIGLDTISGNLYNAISTSADGVVWSNPTFLPTMGDNALQVILDDGSNATYPNLRYRSVLRQLTPLAPPLWAADLWYSADGRNWTKGANLVPTPYGECYSLFRDLGGFSLLHRWNLPGYSWTDAEGVLHTNTKHDAWVRAIGFGVSPDGNTFHPSQLIFKPGTQDHGETQFYYVSNIIQRGNLRLGAMGVLRDDIVVSDAPAGAYGSGYTTLVWSIDGINWTRYNGLDPQFLSPSPTSTDWDHAITWITAIVEVGDDVLLYYGGYQWGHKVGTDRQIGMVQIKRDRFVSRHADATTVLRTKLVTFNANSLTLNSVGQIRVQITDQTGTPISGFSYADSNVVSGDYLDAKVIFKNPLPQNQAVHLEFELTNADLYAFYLA